MPEARARRTAAGVSPRGTALPRTIGPVRVALAARAFARACVAAAASILAPAPALTQQVADDFPFPSLVEEVLPGATSFEVRDGDPRVIIGYAADTPAEDALVGYAFLTSDVPPEELGYNGPIEVLVGMDREGTLTGVRVTHYVESYIRTRGDFLRTPGYEAQFTGKSISDPFRAKRDVRVVSRATISVSAMSRGIRAAARRVYANYLATRPSAESGGSLLTIGREELEELSWSDMVAGELVPQIHVLENNVTRIVLSFAHIRSDSVGEMLVGRGRFGEVAEQLGERVREDPLMLVGVDGALALLFYPRTLSLVQGADTIDMDNPDVVMLGEPRSGMVQGQFRNVGVMAVPGSLDVEQAFDIYFDLRPGMGLYSTAYPPPQLPRRVVAEDAPAADEPDPAEPVAQAGDPAGGAAGHAPDATATAEEGDAMEAAPESDPAMTDAAAPAAAGESSSPDDPTAAPVPVDGTDPADGAGGDPAPPASPSEAAAEESSSAAVRPAAPPDLDFSLAEEQTVLERSLARTSPAEVAWMLGLLALVTVAFFLKRDRVRWVALVATFLYLGWFDGGFLSVSHITAAISVGPAVFLEDVPLLLFVVFTVVTTLLVGRVFCGFLCPFGVLQDFLEKVVPRKFKRELPRALHERLYLAKYVCLAAILLPALAGSRASIFSFFEPFGTVFFLSSSIVLWAIAGAILVASAIVPRFYCRYACPLGAALAVASTVSPFRIRRVEHCDHCKVCEQVCPTGAIGGPRIDFRECVRCNICETKLIEQAGVCRHDIDEVRRRLVQLKVAPSAGLETGA